MVGWKKRTNSVSLFALCFFTSGNWWFSTSWATIKRASCQKNANNQSISINQRPMRQDKPKWAAVAGGGAVFAVASNLTLTTGLGNVGNWYLSPQTQFGSRYYSSAVKRFMVYHFIDFHIHFDISVLARLRFIGKTCTRCSKIHTANHKPMA